MKTAVLITLFTETSTASFFVFGRSLGKDFAKDAAKEIRARMESHGKDAAKEIRAGMESFGKNAAKGMESFGKSFGFYLSTSIFFSTLCVCLTYIYSINTKKGNDETKATN